MRSLALVASFPTVALGKLARERAPPSATLRSSHARFRRLLSPSHRTRDKQPSMSLPEAWHHIGVASWPRRRLLARSHGCAIRRLCLAGCRPRAVEICGREAEPSCSLARCDPGLSDRGSKQAGPAGRHVVCRPHRRPRLLLCACGDALLLPAVRRSESRAGAVAWRRDPAHPPRPFPVRAAHT